MTQPASDILFACDVGNTRAAVSLVVGGRIEQVVRVPLGAMDGLADCLRLDPAAACDARTAPVIASSVNPSASDRLRVLAAALTPAPLLLARTDFPVPIATSVDHPERVGVDRLLAALAAWGDGGRPVIVVDVGTAVTVDAVDAAGRFLGGSILPGPSLGAWALQQQTAALPEVNLAAGPPAGAIGKNTESAIRAGLVLGTAGAVERLVAEQRRALGGLATVVATGGALDLLRAALGCIDDVRPDLVLEGLVAAWRARR